MIHELYISNYALIQEAKLNFSDGFHVFTGETGAGKSIFLGALGLVMGKRADPSILIDKEKKCISELIFHLEDSEPLKTWFFEQELDFDATCIVRREIWPNGKSRAFINDSPVNLNQLKDLADQLLDIHGQHENLALKNKNYKINWLDCIADAESLAQEFATAFAYRNKLQQQKENYLNDKANHQRKLDFLNFQLAEWQALKWQVGEHELIEAKVQQLQQAESLQLSLRNLLEFLLEENHIVDELKKARHLAQKLNPFVSSTLDLLNRLETARIDLADLGLELQRLEHEFAPDPIKLEQGKERLNAFLTLLRKHQCQDEKEMLFKAEQWLTEKNELENLEMAQLGWDTEIESWTKRIAEVGKSLTESRKRAAANFEHLIAPLLPELGLEEARIQIDFNPLPEPNILGFEEIQFLYSPHAKLPPKPLEQIASGGELSRIMLIFKLLAAQKKAQPTLIFDEIDTGISGKIAGKMGTLLADSGNSMQIMAITHLPQIASKGKRHFKVEKIQGATRIRELTYHERIEELAGMLSAEVTTENALEHARELLNPN
jgi:DNA repair protein RecN (Recombination protein N)